MPLQTVADLERELLAKRRAARRKPKAVRLLEAQMAVVNAILAEWGRGTSDDRNHADDLSAAIDKVQVD